MQQEESKTEYNIVEVEPKSESEEAVVEGEG